MIEQLEAATVPQITVEETPATISLRRDVLQNRGRILEAAAELFRQSGVDNVSMHQIAMAAGIGQGTLYRNFEHKGVLCAALASVAIISLQHDVNALIASDGPAVETLDHVLERFLDFSEEFAPVICGISDAACGSRRMDFFRSPMYGWMHRTMGSLLERAHAEGDMHPSDIDYTADAVLALFDINLRLFQRRERGFTRERILAGMRMFLARGLGVKVEGRGSNVPRPT